MSEVEILTASEMASARHKAEAHKALVYAYAVAEEGFEKFLVHASLEVFREVVKPLYEDCVQTPRLAYLLDLIQEVMNRRKICKLCFSGFMEGGGGRGYHSSTTCSNLECGHVVNVST